MSQAQRPAGEGERLEALRRYKILDTLPERAFDDLALLAAHICDAPIALIGFMDADRQWFKSAVGLTMRELPLSVSFCAHAIVESDLCVVRDARADARFADNPLVTSYPHIRSYAAAQLVTSEGRAIGSLCVMDRRPRDLSPEQREALRVLARQVMAQLELRWRPAALDRAHEELERRVERRTAELTVANASLKEEMLERGRAEEALRVSEERYRTLFEQSPDGMLIVDPRTKRILESNPAYQKMLGYGAEELRGMSIYDIIAEDAATVDLNVQTAVAREQTCISGRHQRRRDGSILDVDVNIARLSYKGADLLYATVRDITERKRAEAELQKSEAELRALFAAMNDVVLELDSHGRYLKVAPTNSRLLFRPAEELMGKTLHEVFPRPYADTFLDHVRHALETRRPVNIDYSLTIDGEEIWFNGTISPMLDDTVVLVARDVTDRKRAEEVQARQARQAALRADVAMGLAGGDRGLVEILQLCAGLLVRHLGAAFARVWMLNEEEQMLELRASAGTHTNTDGPYARIRVGELNVGRVAAERRPYLTNDVRHNSGLNDHGWAEREGVVALAGYPLIVENKLLGVLAIFAREALAEDTLDTLSSVADTIAQSIERRRAAEALQASEERYRRIVETAQEGIWQLDTQSRTSFVNRRMAEMLGYTEEEMLGSSLFDFMDDAARATAEQNLQKRRRGISESHDFRLRRKDGTEIWAIVSATPILTVDGQFAGTLGMVTDITERREAERDRVMLLLRLLNVQEEERRRLARELHDELGQYLPALQIGLKSLETLCDQRAAQERLRELQGIAKQLAEQAHHVARDLRPTALDDIGLQAALSNFVEEWSERSGVTVDFHSNGLLGRLQPEIETTIYRVVQEALTNVLKHAQAQRVSLIVENRQGMVRAIVEDDGVGFDLESVRDAHITKRRLGLLGMQERVALTGGNLEIESAPGIGTTIVVRIPTPADEERVAFGEQITNPFGRRP